MRMMEKIASIKRRLRWLDPFTYVDLFVIPRVRALSKPVQWGVFAASYVVLLALVSLVLGATLFFLLSLSLFYAYLFFFEGDEAIDWAVYLLSAFLFAWAIFALLGALLSTSSPMIIVVSGSMEPLYYRGDVIVLRGVPFEGLSAPEVHLEEPISGKPFSSFAKADYASTPNGIQIEALEFNNGERVGISRDGSVIVYFSRYLGEPIIHRVVSKIIASDGRYVLTKGDSVRNNTIDQDCGRVQYGVPEKQCISLYPVGEEEIEGSALFRVPLVGCVKLWLFDDLSSLLARGALPKAFRGIC
jgi:signal peptidase I